MVESNNVKKARIKSLDLAKRTVDQRVKEESALVGAEKIKFEIGNLENVIRNCKLDLAGPFKHNMAIQNKLELAEKQLVEKQAELKKLGEKV